MTQSKNIDPVSKKLDPVSKNLDPVNIRPTFSMELALSMCTRRTAARSWRFEVGNG